jgi:hypothetical protein
MGSGTTVQVYPGVRKVGLWSFASVVGVSANEMKDAECRRVKGEEKNTEGRREKDGVGGLTGAGEPGNTRAAQADIADTVLERRRGVVRTGVGGRGSVVRIRGEGGWARKS